MVCDTSGLAQQPPKRDREGRVGTQAGQGFGEKQFEVLGRLGTRDRSRTYIAYEGEPV